MPAGIQSKVDESDSLESGIMRRKAPQASDCMTHLPVEAERCETVADATKMMADHGIRHLPLMSGSRLRGLISDRDLQNARLRFGESAERMMLEEICQRDVLTVSPLTPIDEVADRMLARRVGSALVVDGGYVVGMFTSTDALQLLRGMFAK